MFSFNKIFSTEGMRTSMANAAILLSSFTTTADRVADTEEPATPLTNAFIDALEDHDEVIPLERTIETPSITNPGTNIIEELKTLAEYQPEVLNGPHSAFSKALEKRNSLTAQTNELLSGLGDIFKHGPDGKKIGTRTHVETHMQELRQTLKAETKQTKKALKLSEELTGGAAQSVIDNLRQGKDELKIIKGHLHQLEESLAATKAPIVVLEYGSEFVNALHLSQLTRTVGAELSHIHI